MPRQTRIKCDRFINNPEEADLSDESDTSDIDSESDNEEDDVLIYSKYDSSDEREEDTGKLSQTMRTYLIIPQLKSMIVGQICEICVHFRQKVQKFAYRGIFVHRIQKFPDPRDLSNGSASILNFQNGQHDERLEVTKTASSSLTSMKFGIEGYILLC